MPRFALLGLLLLALGKVALAQVPVEVFGGHERTTLDVLFFKYVKNQAKENSRFLFFNRNRASVDYRQTSTTYLPTFGFTEAISYNHPALKGLAPVVTVQVFNTGVFAKAGLQYFHRSEHVTLFTWTVVELARDPLVDWFVLARWEPPLSAKLKLFSQLELVNAFPTAEGDNYSFIQRVRVGVRRNAVQVGLGCDWVSTGRSQYSTTTNAGVFLRYEFP